MDFGRSPVDNCPAFTQKVEVTLPDFLPTHLYGKETKTFTVEIGQAGGEQGYLALTGMYRSARSMFI